MTSEILLRGIRLQKHYAQGDGNLEILKGLDIELCAGEALGVVGASGAGKSTLLHILGGLDRPTLGQIFFENKDLMKMSEDELAEFRGENVGFVFQFHHLLAEFTAIENVLMPLRISGKYNREALDWADHLLNRMGLAERKHHFPSQLSGGELQRVAIARALIRKPKLLLADEPTGNLDTQTSQLIQNLLFQLHKDLRLTLMVVTHDVKFAEKFSKVLRMKDGLWV